MRTAEQLRYLVLAAQLEGRRQWSRALRPLGLTPSQAEVLRVLQDYGPASVGSVGALLVCESGTNPSRLVDRLVDAGLVHRRADEGDARAVVLSLTPEGLSHASRVQELESAMYEHLDQVAGPDADAAIRFLRGYVEDTPVGQSFHRREVQISGTARGTSQGVEPG
ncbi:MAG TPA: MarR family transcriptional regulator [Phycicoccus elongatus]|nr:MarR family transcriptional regulator [Phycicoccus elongatus]